MCVYFLIIIHLANDNQHSVWHVRVCLENIIRFQRTYANSSAGVDMLTRAEYVNIQEAWDASSGGVHDIRDDMFYACASARSGACVRMI